MRLPTRPVHPARRRTTYYSSISNRPTRQPEQPPNGVKTENTVPAPRLMASTPLPPNKMEQKHDEESSSNPDHHKGPSFVAQVKAKEGCVQSAMSDLLKLQQTMSSVEFALSDVDVSTWQSMADKIVTENGGSEFRVGVAGDTGIGKSTLINTLLGYKKSITPESSRKACTATICRIRYNHDSSGDNKFRAEVRIKPKRVVEDELRILFDELKLLDEHDEERMALDSELRARRDTLDEQVKLVASWSGLRSTTVRELGVAGLIPSITRECHNGSELFNFEDPSTSRTLYRNHKSIVAFGKMMRALMGATGAANHRLIWPLIDVIDIYVVSDILKNGIVLVDLPGQMDALAARSDVAKREYRHLDVLLVATPAHRAADNSTAMNLIRGDQIVDMEAQGKMSENSLAVVITKVDTAKNWQEFVETEMEDSDKSATFMETMDQYFAVTKRLVKIDRSISRTKNQQKIGQLTIQQTALKIQQTELGGMCLKFCIDVRAAYTKKQFQDYFDSVRNSFYGRSEVVRTTLPVFPVSSDAQRQLLETDEEKKKRTRTTDPDLSFAFPDARATGFHQLAQWLKESSLKTRNLKADNILSRLSRLFESIQVWTENGVVLWAMAKLPQSHLPRIQQVVDSDIQNLRKTLHTFTKTLKSSLETFQESLCPKTVTAQMFNEKFNQEVARFSLTPNKENLHSATFGACIARQGGPFRSSGKQSRTIHWQGDISAMYWSRRAVAFSKAPIFVAADIEKSLLSSVTNMLRQHITNLFAGKFPHEYEAGLKPFKQRMENWAVEYQATIRSLGADFKRRLQNLQENSKEELTMLMHAMFEKAILVKGKGKFVTQKQLIESWASQHGEPMFVSFNAWIQTRVEAACTEFAEQITTASEDVVTKLHELELQTAREICMLQGSDAKRAPLPNEILAFQNQLQEHTAKWQQLWTALKDVVPGMQLDNTHPDACQAEADKDTKSSLDDEADDEDGFVPIQDEEDDGEEQGVEEDSDYSDDESDDSGDSEYSDDAKSQSPLKRQAVDELSSPAKRLAITQVASKTPTVKTEDMS